MQIKFFNNEGECIREAKIAATALTAPSTISFGGRFFHLKVACESATQKFLAYKQCRGAFLSDIELVKGVEVHDF